MTHKPEQYNTWLDNDKHLPENEHRMYWVSDGKNINLARFDISKKDWKPLWMSAAFKVKYFMPIKLPRPPTAEEN